MSNMKVVIYIPSRLHFALCDLRPVSLYANGGIGLGIEEPYIKISCSIGSGSVELQGEAVEWKTKVNTLLKNLDTFIDISKIDLNITSHFPAHSGFGSHTALALGVIEAAGILSQTNWTEHHIIDISKRGGTSGVGIQTYFRGGVAYDFGTPEVPSKFLPSSSSSPKAKPVFGPRVEFPPHWEILLALPDGRNVFGDEELNFFAAHTPLGEVEALRTIASIHHGVIPAITSANLETLAAALRLLHLTGFKALELRNQSQSVRDFYSALVMREIACGMSSFGPLLYAIVDKGDDAARKYFEATAVANSARYFGRTVASTGRKVIIT